MALWTLVNRNTTDATPSSFQISLPCSGKGDHFYDLFSGEVLTPAGSDGDSQQQEACSGGEALLSGVSIQAGGLGSVLRISSSTLSGGGAATAAATPPPSLTKLLKQMRNLTHGVILSKLDNGVALEDAPIDVVTTKVRCKKAKIDRKLTEHCENCENRLKIAPSTGFCS